MSDLWLPKGAHYDLNIEHAQLEDAGPFVVGKPKLVLHTTESPQEAVDSMWRTVRDKRAAPHFVYGYREGFRYPVVIQCIALNRSGRALDHQQIPETNRANCIQIEICGEAATSHFWSDNYMRGLCNLALLIQHRFPFPTRRPRRFPGRRFRGDGFVNATGIVGHCHVPGNDHTDPGRFDGRKFVRMMKKGRQDVRPR